MGFKLLVLVGIVLVFAGVRVQANSLTTSAIVSSVASTECMDYQVVGVCVWLQCDMGCRVRTSIKVRHYIPELVVSSYNETGANPWTDIASMSPPLSGRAEGGGNMTPRHSSSTNILRFKNADAIGHPGARVFSAFASNSQGMICNSGTQAFWPHFLSTLDFIGWRHGLAELMYPASYVPGMRELGQLGDQWGNVYPRSGFVSQADDYRAGALAAQRVADLVTRSGSPHAYYPLTPRTRAGWWPPEPVVEGDESTHKWQPLHPQLEQSCAVWPDRGVAASYGDRMDGLGDYAWALWRPYSCCRRRGQTLLSHTGE